MILISRIGCSQKTAHIRVLTKSFQFFKLKDTLQITVNQFFKNDAACCQEGIPYALIIGIVSDNKDYPKVISVLAICDNKVYRIGQHLKIVANRDPRIGSSLNPINFGRDTVVNHKKYACYAGSEFPAIWADVVN